MLGVIMAGMIANGVIVHFWVIDRRSRRLVCHMVVGTVVMGSVVMGRVVMGTMVMGRMLVSSVLVSIVPMITVVSVVLVASVIVAVVTHTATIPQGGITGQAVSLPRRRRDVRSPAS